jgi:hypothetical protein
MPPSPPRQVRPPVVRRTSPFVAAGVILAILLGAAALVVSLTGIGHQSTQPAATATSTPTTPSAGGDTTDADRALCQAIGPLIQESLQDGKDFVNLGFSGTPERDGDIPAYRAKVDAWVDRIQPVLDQHANPPRYLTRMTQMFVDFTHSYAENIRPGPVKDVDTAAWNNRVVALGGPFELCKKYGVTW